MNTQRNHNRIALILLLGGLLLMAGCGGKVTPVHCYIGLDASQSARPHLGGYTLLSGQLSGRLNAGVDALTLYRLDDHVTEFSDQPASGSLATTLTAIARNVQQVSPGRGTFPAKYWEEVAARAEQAPADVVILLFTDGDNDDQRAASTKSIRVAAERLAQNPRVKQVILCGVEQRNYAWLHACFASLGEKRFHLLNPVEMDISTLADYVEQARKPATGAAETGSVTEAHR